MNKKKRTLEFLTIFTAVVGTMFGIGIYVKNDNLPGHVLGDVGNPIIALILWAVVGFVIITLIIVFLEVASSTSKSGNGTISNWLRLFVGRKTGSVAGLYYVFIYLPINYGFFATIIVSYILAAAGNPISNKGELAALYLVFGLLFIVFFSMLNCFFRDYGKMFQIVGTIIKMIPISLVLIALVIPDTTWGVFFNSNPAITAGSNGGNTWSTSLEDIQGARIFAGLAPILFAFNGFISAANLQSETENKDVVGKAILWGVIFSAIFYFVIALALFLGSKDGSVVSFFDYMFNGFKTAPDGTIPHSGISTLISNLILAIVCLISMNSYTLLGPNFFHSDVKEGIIFAKNKKITLIKAAIFQMLLGAIMFIILVLLGIFTGANGNVVYYFDQASNAGAVIAFTFYIILVIGVMINRKTKRVTVVKLKSWVFWLTSIFSLVMLLLMVSYLYADFLVLSAIGPNRDLAKPISMLGSFVAVLILWIANELLFKKTPFNFAEMNTTFPIPKPQKRFVWEKKSKKK